MFKDTIVITNRNLVRGDYFEQLETVLKLHPSQLILREKELCDEEYEKLLVAVLRLCDQYKVTCFSHTHPLQAERCGCRNIHLSIASLQAMEKEKLRRTFEKISVSCHSLEDVRIAEEYQADQIILGTIFETDCKPGLSGKGLAFVSDVCSRTALPVYAIGGVSLERLTPLREAGAKGGCMMSFFMQYPKGQEILSEARGGSNEKSDISPSGTF